MKILVLGDTHLTATTLDRMPHEVWAAADDADVVLHTGDVVDGAVIDALAERAVVHAVLGNNDHALIGTLPDVIELDLGGLSVAMLHDAGPTAGRASRLRRRFPEAEVVVFGHSHQPLAEQTGHGVVLFNPGSPTQRRRQPVHTVGWLEITDGTVRRTDIIEVGPLAGTAADR